jgi:LysM repeat protein
MRLAVLSAIAAIALGVAGQGQAAAQQPPRNLHRVGDHWTAWDPPTEFPPGAEVYTIVRGDTLWSLAARFYGDPYLWPQLWERNSYIRDAHWIYPGDPLVISLEIAPLDQLTDVDLGDVSFPAPEPEGLLLDRRLGVPVPLGTEDDIYCSGYIGPMEEHFGYRIVGSEYQALSPTMAGTGRGGARRGKYGDIDTVKVDLSLGDIVYLDGGRAAGLAPGLVFTAVVPGEIVAHPATGHTIGRFFSYRGRVRVLTVQDQLGVGEIVQACGPIRLDAGLRPFVPEPVPLGRRTMLRPPSDPVDARVLTDAPVIVHSRDGVVSLGEDHVVYFDRGAEDGVVPGDVYTIYRVRDDGMPPLPLGELAVLSVQSRTALARILESRYAIYRGDRLHLK